MTHTVRLFARANQDNVTNLTHRDSIRAISTMFPNIQWIDPTTPANPVIDWTGNKNPKAFPTAGILLEGDQCLVFFLGGIPGPGGSVSGFSKNQSNPALPDGERFKFYDFQVSRLKTLRSGNPFPSYLNPYTDNPVAYAYFSVGARGQK